ncbi:MAG: tRNA 2-thiouridine(34) synthase MnmA [Candidatus Omnitrophica bacterium]|nr:tRNA 2-thiouridine(34) synthase MnmA [Candidatus Omnitrophota bacterium]MBI5144813.1 tRNA 2-thiouridine(34) synthase MnmA [Candidatus Omnitrophota bacterium]
MMKKRVVVAMSGGVDSSVAAALLKKEGYEVIGITMCFNLSEPAKRKPICCGMQAIDDARGVAHKLGIRHYVLNMQQELEKWVIRNFCQEYLRGRTPNPCVRCNQYIKFAALLKKALGLGAGYLATGHYARIERNQKYLLKKAKDRKKDQSYFLYRLNQKQLKHILFPLGNYTKEEVRGLAREFGLSVADKLGSQEICFLPGQDYRGFLKTQMRLKIKPGAIVDKQGNVLGQHQGIAFYTIGQREGLGIAKGYPLYITKIDARNNMIIVGRKEDTLASEFLVKEPHFIFQPLKKEVVLKVKIRYNHPEARAKVMLGKNKITVQFKEPQFAITPGQSAVFYDGDEVLGGGIITLSDAGQ